MTLKGGAVRPDLLTDTTPVVLLPLTIVDAVICVRVLAISVHVVVLEISFINITIRSLHLALALGNPEVPLAGVH